MLFAISNYHGYPVLIQMSTETISHLVAIVNWQQAEDDLVQFVFDTGIVYAFDTGELTGNPRNMYGNELDGSIWTCAGEKQIDAWLVNHVRPFKECLSDYELETHYIQDGIDTDDPVPVAKLIGDEVPIREVHFKGEQS